MNLCKIDHSLTVRRNAKIFNDFLEWANSKEHRKIFDNNELGLKLNRVIPSEVTYGKFKTYFVFVGTPKGEFYSKVTLSASVITDAHESVVSQRLLKSAIQSYEYLTSTAPPSP